MCFLFFPFFVKWFVTPQFLETGVYFYDKFYIRTDFLAATEPYQTHENEANHIV